MEPVNKAAKLNCDNAGESISDCPTELPSSFLDLKVDSIITDNPQHKLLVVKGRFGCRPDPAVILLEKQAFNKDNNDVLFSGDSVLENLHSNDIYSTYIMHPPPEVNGIKTTIIYPATEKHIEKYTAQEQYLMTESPEDYKNITLPYLELRQFSLQWVYNILDKKAETERVFYRDPDPEIGFVMVPDMKWDLKDASCLYVSAIINKRGLKSLRDLRTHHLPLLRNIRDKGVKSIQDTYKVDESKLCIYFHYQPSYYHLHVHFSHVQLEAPGSRVDRARFLSDVIYNITMAPEYYAKAPLVFKVKANDPLLLKYRDERKL